MQEEFNPKVLACKFANKLLASDDDYLDNVLELWRLGREIYGEGWNTEFHIFGAISTETDHLPVSKVRQYCSKAMLERSDAEILEAISFYRGDVSSACNEILLKFKNV